MSIQRKKSPCYCINLRRLANSVTNIYDTFLKPIDLSVNQFSLLLNIDQLQICSVSDLATYIGLERTTLVRTLQPLFNRELIEDISEISTRNRKIQTTEKGKQLVVQGLPLWHEAQNMIQQKLGKEHLEVLSEIFLKMN